MTKKTKCNKAIDALLILKEKTVTELAESEGLELSSMRSKLSRATYKLDDLISYAQFLGVDIGFKDGDNFYSFIEDEKKTG